MESPSASILRSTTVAVITSRSLPTVLRTILCLPSPLRWSNSSCVHHRSQQTSVVMITRILTIDSLLKVGLTTAPLRRRRILHHRGMVHDMNRRWIRRTMDNIRRRWRRLLLLLDKYGCRPRYCRRSCRHRHHYWRRRRRRVGPAPLARLLLVPDTVADVVRVLGTVRPRILDGIVGVGRGLGQPVS